MRFIVNKVRQNIFLIGVAIGMSAMLLGSSVQAATLSQKTPYDIVELGAALQLPGRLTDLGYKVVYEPGDQAPSTVEFTTKRLAQAGCIIDMAPMGKLTYRSDLGGTKVHRVRGTWMYYVRPDGSCRAPARLQQWQQLRAALARSLHADGQ